jgi:hypothetical protein
MKNRAGHIVYSSSPAAAFDAARFLALRPGGPTGRKESWWQNRCASQKRSRTLKDGTLASRFPTRM